MLKGIPAIISPELMLTLMQMGHGDALVIGDANFPGFRIARHTESKRLIRLDGQQIPALLDAILTLMPLDYAVDCPVTGMLAPEESGVQPIHDLYKNVLSRHGYAPEQMRLVPRFDFYECASNAFAVAITSESARFANLILQKGVVVLP